MDIKELLKKFALSDADIEKITAEGATEETVNEVIDTWDKSLTQVILDKKEVKQHFRDQFVPNALAEGKIKERKKINSAYSLGLSNSQMAGMDDAEWEALLKSSLSKSDDDEKKTLKDKVDKLAKDYQLLEDTLEKTKSETDRIWKSKYSSKAFNAEVNKLVGSLDNMILGKDQILELIEAKKIMSGINIDLEEDDSIVLKDKDGNAIINGNKRVGVSDWLNEVVSPYKIKSNAPPANPIENGGAGGNGGEVKKSARVLELEAKVAKIKEEQGVTA